MRMKPVSSVSSLHTYCCFCAVCLVKSSLALFEEVVSAKRSLARSPIISFHGLLGIAFTSTHPRSVEGRKSTFIYLAR